MKRKKYGNGDMVQAPMMPYRPDMTTKKYGTPQMDWSGHAPSGIDQFANDTKQMAGAIGPYGQVAAGVIGWHAPIAQKVIEGKENELNPMQQASKDFYGKGVYGLITGFNKGKRNQSDIANQKQQVNQSYNQWSNKEQKPYDTAGFYQLAKYGIGVQGYNGPKQKMFMADGGPVLKQPVSNVPIEAEGQEEFMYPNGRLEQIKGPSHENGGVKMNAKEGSKIYSNRIKARQELIERFKNF